MIKLDVDPYCHECEKFELEYCLRQFNVRAFSVCSEENSMHYLFKK